MQGTDRIASPEVERHLCRVAAALCCGSEDQLRDAFRQASAEGVLPSQLREVVLTSYLFDGYPTALEGFRILAEFSRPSETECHDLHYSPRNVETWLERGIELCRAVYGPNFERLIERVAAIAPELREAMLVEGYGKVLAREGLDPVVRELCVVAMLATKHRPRQLLSHVLGALRLGADSERLHCAVEAATEVSPEEVIGKAKVVLKEAIDSLRLP